MISRKLLKNLDVPFIIAVVLVLIMGILILSSATLNVNTDQWFYVKKQIVGITLGLICLSFVLIFDYGIFLRYANYIYGFNLFLLTAVLVTGRTAKGAQSWLDLGPLGGIQPSELAKVMVIITLAAFLVKRQDNLDSLRGLIPVFVHVGIPLVLIMLEPDLGTSLVFIAITFGMLFIAGARSSLLLKILGSGALVIALALIAHFKFGLPLPLEDYQLKRLIVFINPYLDGRGGRGAGWHVIQSLVAVGSGGFWGKGLFNGTQVQGNFLPEHHTDFIFSVVGEELGFIGTTFLLAIYFTLLYRAIRIALKARDSFGTLIAIGIASMWGFHILENVGMSIGIMPITGIPLPFLSYGGSSMLANLISVGLLLNINLRREKILF
ncbi:MAG: rod shape-determining protein RodA [Bacillota bacterium]